MSYAKGCSGRGFGLSARGSWRRGSVVSSWLLDLTADALATDEPLNGYSGAVADSADLTVLNHQQAVFEILVGRFYSDFGWVGDAVQDGGAVGFASHDVSQVVARLRLDDGSKCVMGSARAVCWPKWAL